MAALLLLLPATAAATGGGHGVDAELWLALAAILLLAKLGAEIALRLRQPPVLGELFVGIVLGNLDLVGVHLFDGVTALPSVQLLAELGVVLLLFQVGLESSLHEMREVAPQSGLVALVGVIAPIVLGYLTSLALMPAAPPSLHLFVGATLCATSVGITARVLKDLDAMDRPETRIILGAAVLDDVLGLMVLAIVSAIALSGAVPGVGGLARIVGLAIGFLAGALLLGAFGMPTLFRAASRLRTGGVLSAIAIGLCLLLAGLSAAAGLAAIVGAFAAGLILDDVHVRPFGKRLIHEVSDLIAPIVAVLAPVFFVRTGMMVVLSDLGLGSLVLAGALSVVAVASKLVAGLGARGGVDRLTVGIGMVPRGEVGLIFADAGARIAQGGHALIEPSVYGAIVLMVMVSTVVTPPWLARRLRKGKVKGEGGAPTRGDGTGEGIAPRDRLAP